MNLEDRLWSYTFTIATGIVFAFAVAVTDS